MRSFRSSVFASVIASTTLGLFGCSGVEPSSGAAPRDEISSPIIDGVLDSGAHPAVVALLASYPDGSGTECTATIVKTDVPNNVGWILTAAHCVLAGDGEPAPKASQMYVVTGDDYNKSPQSAYHAVLDFMAQPGAAPPQWDLAIVKFSGVTATMPTIPIVTADLDMDLASGTPVEVVGFGQTQTGGGDNNSKKWKLDGALGAVDGYDAVDDLDIGLPVGPMGQNICQGDSGGPWLRTINGTQYIIAVSSVEIQNAANQGCMAGGVGARVTQALDTFINPYLNGGTVTVTCGQCKDAAESAQCQSQAGACSQDLDCYSEATNCSCADGDTACITACQSAHAAGMKSYDALVACYCGAAVCQTECATTLCAGSGGAGGAAGAGGSGGAAGSSGATGTSGSSGVAGGENAGAGGSVGMGGAATAGAGGSSAGEGGTNAAGAPAAGGTSSQSGTGGVATAGAGGSSGGTSHAGASATGGSGVSGTGGTASGASGASGANSQPTAATSAPADSGGCGCNVPSNDRSGGGAALLAGLLALAVKRRRGRGDAGKSS